MKDSDYEILGSWLIPAINLLKNYPQCDAEKLFASVGFDINTQANGVYVAADKVNQLLEAVVTATGDPIWHLKLALYVEAVTFQSLGFTVSVAENGRQMLGFIVKYNRLLSNTCDLQLQQTEHEVTLTIHHKMTIDRRPVLSTLASHGFISSVKSLTERLSQGQITPDYISVADELNETQRRAYQQFLGCEIKDKSGSDSITFSASTADQPLPMANPILVQLNEQVLSGYLATLEHSNLSWKIKAHLLSHQPFCLITAEDMASHFFMSVRSFQRRLQALGTSYTEIVDQAREDRARQLLDQQTVSMSEIAFQLGFSNASNFSSAFKRWVGVTPNQYRHRPHIQLLSRSGKAQQL